MPATAGDGDLTGDAEQFRHRPGPPAAPGPGLLSGLLSGPCGAVTEDTTLTEDLDCNLFLVGDGITLDLGGHTVRATIVVVGDGNEVRNGTVTNPGNFALFVLGSDALLEALAVTGSGDPFAVEAGDGTSVRRSTFSGNELAVSQFFGSGLTVEHSVFTGNGIGVSVQAGDGAVVEHNRFVGGGTGVNVWDEDLVGARDTLVARNTFDGAGVAVRVEGVADATGTVVERNTIHRSAASGVLVTTGFGPGVSTPAGPAPGGAAGTVVRDNTITASGSEPRTVEACLDEDTGQATCATTADDGLTVLSLPEVAATMTVAGNRAIRNADLGIEAPGVTDGGGNRGAANGNPAQCVGVAC